MASLLLCPGPWLRVGQALEGARKGAGGRGRRGRGRQREGGMITIHFVSEPRVEREHPRRAALAVA
eukprot:2610504-Rhodomonas_salina.4